VSYDVHIWSVYPISLPSTLPDRAKWQQQGDSWIYEARNWQIVVEHSVKVLSEDIPEEAAKLLAGISYLADLSLEPINAPKNARKLLKAVSAGLSKAAHGLIVDPQTDIIETPSGVKRYQPQKREERFSILDMSWWFGDGPLLKSTGVDDFFNLLEKSLPEAIPKRYGLFEPPQHVYAETGKEHFLAFLHEHLNDVIVWYPNRPVVNVSLHCSVDWGADRRGFRVNYVEIGIESAVLEQPGWKTAISRFWRAASKVIQPFYGDVRTMKGFVRMGATFGSDIQTDFHPVKGPWWTGIPRVMGHAAVLGPPYLSLWPKFVETAKVEDGIAFLSTTDWAGNEEASNLVGGVPDAIAQRWVPTWADVPYGGKAIRYNTEYPPVWPFEKIVRDSHHGFPPSRE
jgi:hypothetical protein